MLADIEGYGGHDETTRADLALRLTDVLDRTLRSAGGESGGAWRQDRGSRQLVVLSAGLDLAIVVPLLIRGVGTQLTRDRSSDEGIPLRLGVSVVRDTVTQAKGGYVGRAVVTATRLVESP